MEFNAIFFDALGPKNDRSMVIWVYAWIHRDMNRTERPISAAEKTSDQAKSTRTMPSAMNSRVGFLLITSLDTWRQVVSRVDTRNPYERPGLTTQGSMATVRSAAGRRKAR
jgi:hypothetical protein